MIAVWKLRKKNMLMDTREAEKNNYAMDWHWDLDIGGYEENDQLHSMIAYEMKETCWFHWIHSLISAISTHWDAISIESYF